MNYIIENFEDFFPIWKGAVHCGGSITEKSQFSALT